MEKIIQLPTKETILRRLLRISSDSVMRDYLYPLLLENAEQMMTPHEVVELLHTSIHVFIDTHSNFYAPNLYPRMQNLIPDLIFLLIEDTAAVSQALDIHDQTPLISPLETNKKAYTYN